MDTNSFSVKHFIPCLAATWNGMPGLRTTRTLEGVGYFLVMDPGLEPPFQLTEYCFFARFYFQSKLLKPIKFRIVMNRVIPSSQNCLSVFKLGTLDFRSVEWVVDVVWPIRPFIIPLAGQFKFTLQYLNRSETGLKWKTVARDFLMVEESR